MILLEVEIMQNKLKDKISSDYFDLFPKFISDLNSFSLIVHISKTVDLTALVLAPKIRKITKLHFC